MPEEWRAHFEKLPAQSSGVPRRTYRIRRSATHFDARPQSRPGRAGDAQRRGRHPSTRRKQVRVLELISAFRHRGHKRANIDPLGLMERPVTPVMDLSYHRLSDADLDTVFQTGSFFYGKPEAPLREIIRALEASYCGTIGAEFMHITEESEKLWVQQRLESVRRAP
ncbi:MAG: hypothetical protein U5R48_06350 [Gammaproteobacteria bacterium]|nr:hypothetical protein [Gammaproteobacteria bacterium]